MKKTKNPIFSEEMKTALIDFLANRYGYCGSCE